VASDSRKYPSPLDVFPPLINSSIQTSAPHPPAPPLWLQTYDVPLFSGRFCSPPFILTSWKYSPRLIKSPSCFPKVLPLDLLNPKKNVLHNKTSCVHIFLFILFPRRPAFPFKVVIHFLCSQAMGLLNPPPFYQLVSRGIFSSIYSIKKDPFAFSPPFFLVRSRNAFFC